jgi:hypothetical protein
MHKLTHLEWLLLLVDQLIDADVGVAAVHMIGMESYALLSDLEVTR